MATFETLQAARPSRTRPLSGRPPAGVLLAFGIFLLLLVAALAPGVFTSVDPLAVRPAEAFRPPGGGNWFGTDQLGRDLFSRMVHGASYSLALGVGATLIGLVGGVILGVLAGSVGRGWERLVTRFLDVFLAFPDVLLALITITILGPGLWSLVWAIGIGRIPGAARLVRSQVIQIKGSAYVQSAVGLGLSRFTIARRHVIPNSLGPVIVHSILGVGVCIIFGASLSFLGLGAVPPTPEWGLMLSEARQYLTIAPWLGIWPGVFITVAVISIAVPGRWLQQKFVTRREST